MARKDKNKNKNIPRPLFDMRKKDLEVKEKQSGLESKIIKSTKE
jgi:hypothetical protein